MDFFRARRATLHYTGPNQSIVFGGTSLPHCKSLFPCALYLAHVPAHPQAPEFAGEHPLVNSRRIHALTRAAGMIAQTTPLAAAAPQPSAAPREYRPALRLSADPVSRYAN